MSFPGDSVHAQDCTPWGATLEASYHRGHRLSKIVYLAKSLNKQQTRKQAPESKGEELVTRVPTMYYIQFSAKKKQKNYETWKEIGQCDPYTGKNNIKQVTETACERTQMLNLTEKEFKVAIIKIIKKLMETILKEARWQCLIKLRISIKR